jgi:hypothetical protein
MDGAGTATHLGQWTNVGTMFFDGSSDPPFAASGIVHFTAADGNRVDVSLTGTVDATLTATATYTFIGGTGPFAAVSGTGLLTAPFQCRGGARVQSGRDHRLLDAVRSSGPDL